VRLRTVTLAALAVLAVASCGPFAQQATEATRDPRPLEFNAGPAPWPAPDRVRDRAEAAGLKLGQEGTTIHFHTHLDVFVDGTRVTIPILGFADCCVSPLHTHSESGMLHIESEESAVFTLGQAFALWGVRITEDCIGAYCSANTPIAVYLNGEKQTMSARDLPLAPGAEIVVVIGTSPLTIPSHYDCVNAAEMERGNCVQFK
jgi:hypothetical protein